MNFKNEARKLNHQEVVEEDRKKNLPTNWESKRKWAEYKLESQQKREAAAAQGLDYDRVKHLDVGAEEAEMWNRKKKKKNPDPGFSDYEAATARQYNQLVRQIKPDMNAYEAKKNEM